jgi:hypothetical protein
MVMSVMPLTFHLSNDDSFVIYANAFMGPMITDYLNCNGVIDKITMPNK